jgi:hypothetical protein
MTSLFIHLFFIGFTFLQSWTIPADAHVRVDEIGNVYVISSDAIQLLPGGNSPAAIYSEASFGAIQSLDLRDPLKPMVFFKGSGKMVFLDNTMSVQGQVIDLFDAPVNQPLLACSSVDHHVWVFDGINQELIRISPTFRVTARTGNLMQLIGAAVEPLVLMERDNRIYLVDDKKRVLEFDLFATFLGKRLVPGVVDIDVRKETVYALTNTNEVFTWNRTLVLPRLVDLPPHEELRSINILRDRVFLQSKKELRCFKIN